MSHSFREIVKAWGQLFRLPNLFTVPGDPLIGFLIVKGNDPIDALLIMLSSLLLYLYGLVTNDIADEKEDAKDRPERPIPSGRVSRSQAKVVAGMLAAGGCIAAGVISLQAAFVAVMLLLLISNYSFNLKNRRVGGPFQLALCRVASIVLGAAAVSYDPELFKLLVLIVPPVFFYVYGLSRAAQNETQIMHRNPGSYVFLFGAMLWLPVMGLFSWAFISNETMRERTIDLLVLLMASLAFLSIAVRSFLVLRKSVEPAVTQKTIGILIRNLMFFQAAACACCGAVYPACVLLALVIPARLAARRFYGS